MGFQLSEFVFVHSYGHDTSDNTDGEYDDHLIIVVLFVVQSAQLVQEMLLRLYVEAAFELFERFVHDEIGVYTTTANVVAMVPAAVAVRLLT